MKSLNKYISQVKTLHSLNEFISEKLVINKSYTPYTVTPKNFLDLYDIIKNRLIKYGGGTRKHPIDLNDINTNKINTMCELFELLELDEEIRYPIKYIDISQWDVSNVFDFGEMFSKCTELRSIGDISKWDVSNVYSFKDMFSGCSSLKSVGDLTNWHVTAKNRDAFIRMFFMTNLTSDYSWRISK